jgi:hypothetical protein
MAPWTARRRRQGPHALCAHARLRALLQGDQGRLVQPQRAQILFVTPARVTLESKRATGGVVLDQAETLPRPEDQPRSRYFGGMDLTAFEELLETARQSKQGLAAPAQA